MKWKWHMKHILVVEHDPRITHLLIRDLKDRGFLVTHANSGRESLDIICTSKPDLAVIDTMLPDINGVEVCRRLRQMGYKTLPIMLVSSSDKADEKVRAFDSGADDYITWPIDCEVFAARIRARLRRAERAVRLSRIEVSDLVLDMTTRQVWRSGEPVSLSTHEYDLLELLAENAGQVLTKECIYEHIWGLESQAGWEVIKVYVNYLRTKLNAGGKPNLIHAVRGVGYILKP
jgi:two-component system response regulator MprA